MIFKKGFSYFLSPEGRTNRSEFTRDFLIMCGVLFVLIKISAHLEPMVLKNSSFLLTSSGALAALGQIIVFFVSIPVQIAKRLHDLGASGWWALLMFVPLANIVLFIYVLFIKGNSLNN